MSDVSPIVASFFDAVGPARGVTLESLTEGLPVTARELRARSRRIPWDVFAAIVNRFEQRVGEGATIAAGREASSTPLADTLRPLSQYVVSPRRLYTLSTRWVIPVFYRNLEARIRDLDSREIEIRVDIPQSNVGSAAFFRLAQGALEALPSLVGAPPAAVRAEISSHHARFVVRPPSPRLRDRLAPLLRVRGVRSILEVLVEQEHLLRRSEEEKNEAESLYRTLLDGVTELIAITDDAGRIRYANAAHRSLGYAPEELVGKSVFELAHPDDHAAVAAEFARGLHDPSYRAELEVRVITRSGAIRELQITGVTMLHDPVIKGVVVHGRDVTERKRADRAARETERVYAALLGNLSGMAYRLRAGEAWPLELVTGGALALTGYSPDELLAPSGPGFLGLVDEGDRARVRSRLAGVSNGVASSAEYRIATKGGRRKWVLDVANPVRGPEGDVIAVEGFMTDVSGQKGLEEQLRQARRLEAIGRLAGGVAHDFNNLLSAIVSYAQLARADLEPGDRRRDDILEIERAAERAGELTSQLLAFARRQVVTARLVDVNEITRDVRKLLDRLLGEEVRLETALEERPCVVLGDRAQIEQVLVNLAVNARDAMPRGGTLRIASRWVDVDPSTAEAIEGLAPGPHVAVVVTDTGPGFSAQALEHLFEPFFTTKPAGHGTGLGLATSYGVVRQLGGAIDVGRSEGGGARVTIYLPRFEAAPAAAEPPRSVAAPRGRGEVVLLVEDNELVRKSTARALRSSGYEVLVAESGPEALALSEARDGEIDLLVTDVMMPDMRGPELAAELSARRPSMKVLYISGYVGGSLERVDGGDVALLPKPFTVTELASRVRALLDQSTA